MRAFFLFLLVFGASYAVLDFSGRASTSPAPMVAPTLAPLIGNNSDPHPVQPPRTQPAPTTQSTIESRIADSMRTADELRRMNNLWNQMGEEARLRRTRFDARIQSLKLDRLFEADVLINPDTYEPARRDLRQALELVDGFDIESDRQFKTVPSRLAAMDIRKEMRESAWEGFDSAPAIRDKYLSRAMALERDRVDQLLALLDFVEPRLSRMRVAFGALICDTPADDAMLLKHFQTLAENREKRRKLEAAARAELEKGAR